MKALVTGASSGIGRDLAREFAKLKYDIVLVARNIERMEKLKEELVKDFKVNVNYRQVDLTSRTACINLYNEEKDIDILVNNAGLGDFGRFIETDLEKEFAIIDTDITALHILTKLYLKDMKKRDEGIILNVASIAGFLPGPLMATYYAAKNYVVRLTEGIKEELRRDKSNVKVSLLCPGPVKTNFNNVANVKFELSSLSSEYVARHTVKKLLKGKFYIVPGFTVRCAKFFSKITPNFILRRICYNTQKRKEG